MKRAVFFDRDGVVNISPGAGYVLDWSAFHFSDGIIPALQLCKARGYLTILVTSQQGVGKGLMTQGDLDKIHANMQDALGRHGCAFDGIYACTCLQSDPDCTCRKPSAEMILNAATEHGIDLPGSLLVGDADRDIQMALNAGVPVTIRVESEGPETVPANHRVRAMNELGPLLGSLL